MTNSLQDIHQNSATPFGPSKKLLQILVWNLSSAFLSYLSKWKSYSNEILRHFTQWNYKTFVIWSFGKYCRQTVQVLDSKSVIFERTDFNFICRTFVVFLNGLKCWHFKAQKKHYRHHPIAGVHQQRMRLLALKCNCDFGAKQHCRLSKLIVFLHLHCRFQHFYECKHKRIMIHLQCIKKKRMSIAICKHFFPLNIQANTYLAVQLFHFGHIFLVKGIIQLHIRHYHRHGPIIGDCAIQAGIAPLLLWLLLWLYVLIFLFLLYWNGNFSFSASGHLCTNFSLA